MQSPVAIENVKPQVPSVAEGPYSQTQSLRIDPREGFFHAYLSHSVRYDGDLVAQIYDTVHVIGPVAGADGSNLDAHRWPSAFRQDERVQHSAIRLFSDRFCLKYGMRWGGDGGSQNGGYLGALRLSVTFVPVFSSEPLKEMMDLGNRDRLNFVLLDLILARELKG
jgi:hypothetical protein